MVLVFEGPVRRQTAPQAGRTGRLPELLATYPPRWPRPDRRDQVMQAAQQLWKQMGGTEQGWSDWTAQSPLTNFYAGSGGPNAWANSPASSRVSC